MSLFISRETNQFTLHLKIKGVMDYSTIDQFVPEIPENMTTIVIDFSELTFIDSTGIGSVLTLIYDANGRGIYVEFEGLNEMVRELFDTVGVFRIVEALQKRVK